MVDFVSLSTIVPCARSWVMRGVRHRLSPAPPPFDRAALLSNYSASQSLPRVLSPPSTRSTWRLPADKALVEARGPFAALWDPVTDKPLLRIGSPRSPPSAGGVFDRAAAEIAAAAAAAASKAEASEAAVNAAAPLLPPPPEHEAQTAMLQPPPPPPPPAATQPSVLGGGTLEPRVSPRPKAESVERSV